MRRAGFPVAIEGLLGKLIFIRTAGIRIHFESRNDKCLSRFPGDALIVAGKNAVGGHGVADLRAKFRRSGE
jgi:hypothetical protein